MPRRARPRLQRLEDRRTPAGFFAAAADTTGGPHVKVFDATTGQLQGEFLAYDPAFRGGVRVAIGDVSGDGVADIVTAPGPGGGPHIKVFNGRDLSPLTDFFAYDPAFRGGVSVAVGDVNGDNLPDIITGAGTGGAPHVRVFNVYGGTPAPIAGPLANFFAYDPAFRGGVNVAAGDLDGLRGDELVTAPGQGGGPHVKAFDRNRAVVANFFAYDTSFRGGVNVAAGDISGDGKAEIVTGAGLGGGPHVKAFSGPTATTVVSFLAYATAFTGGVRVASTDLNGDGKADIVTGAGPGGGPHTRYFDGPTQAQVTSVFPFATSFTGGVTVAALTADTAGDPAELQLKEEVSPLERLAKFTPSAIPAVDDWGGVTANDTSLEGKNVYVVAHGWAPGFIDMVQAYQNGNLPFPPLKWWQTINTGLPQSPGMPNSGEMFYGSAGDDVVISPVGVANGLVRSDPNAVVLAYSWVDESATGLFAGAIPLGAYLSEARTSLNGLRLASALQSLLPADFATSGGKLHLIGHSHGSKVATVAALALQRTEDANFDVAHLSLLDSPENASDLASDVDAANNLWYFLGALDIGRTAGTTFVDNTISEFDNPFGVIQGVNPFNTSQTTSVLQNIVDVTLDPGVLLDAISFGDRHAYAFNWYGGASFPWAQNLTPDVANQWSPLLNPATPATLAGNYTQTWTSANQPQFALTAGGDNTVTDTPTFANLALSSTTTTQGASFANGVVTLSEANGAVNPTFTGEFDPNESIAGISFNFEFSNVGAGDQLVISVSTGFLGCQQIHYVMTGTVAGTLPQFATLSLGSLSDPIFNRDKTIQVQLLTTAGSGASVEVRNLQQFVQ